jgi:uncharacterized repeat protein (TIGR01451 family)
LLFTGNFAPSGSFSLMLPQGPSETIETFASNCTTPKTDFDLGDTVCAKFSGAPLGDAERAQRRIGWVSPYGTLAQGADITTDPQNGTYLVPTSQTQTFTDSGGGTVVADNRGTWTVNTYSTADGSLQTSAKFTVHDPATPYVDLSVGQSVSETNSTVSAGSSSVFSIILGNRGPDAAANVVLTDIVPNNTTFVALTQTSGPTFSCSTPVVGGTGTITCSLASLAKDATASFDLAYDVDAGTPNGTLITNNATISSDTAELVADDNSSTKSATVGAGGGGGGGCTLDCPDNVNAVANTTESSQRGAHVTFSAAEPSGTCGAITATPASGSFFPVGTTVVSVSSDTGGGSCSFVVTVEDTGSDPPTISCPGNQTANADSSCSASLTVGTASATGNNVTVFATRSDGKPMYTCDANGTNCVRRSSDDPFAAGITTITWIAHTHSVPGPYADADAEEASRTGAASCTQIITINDVTPPTIVPPANQAASADATCQYTVPDYTALATVSDNCACASSDTSEVCDSRQPITIDQSPAPGTVVGLGSTTITLTANDGSSNNGGAGNSATAQFTVTVSDTTAPTVTAPADSSANADANCQAAVPNYVAGSTAFDNCDSSVTLTQSPAAGTPVGKGPHTVTVTGTDDAGNQGTDTVVFTVNDVTPPTITLNGANPQYVECHTSYPELGATANDNCDGSFAATPSGSVNANVVGTYTITYNASDASGNAATPVTRTVIVQDTIAPTITLNSYAPSMWPPNHNYTTFQLTQFVTGASDSCDTGLGLSDVVIEKVTSDETENGNGDGNTMNDIAIAADCKSVQLRSERQGGGNGRVYTITFKVSDGFNTTRVTAKVVVPKNTGQTPVDSGVNYTVNSSCP